MANNRQRSSLPPLPIRIEIDGRDVTDRWRPYLISANVEDKEGDMDTCSVEMDDTNGQLALPSLNAPISIYFAKVRPRGALTLVFQGEVNKVESSFSRRNGRILVVEGQSVGANSGAKQRYFEMWGDGTEQSKVPLSTVFGAAAAKAGLAVAISPALAQMTRPFWSQQGESFMSFGQRLAREMGGLFKVQGGVATITKLAEAIAASGDAMPTVEAKWGKNLIAWRVQPQIGRPQYSEAATTYFDPATSQWMQHSQDIMGAGGGTGAFGGIASGLTALNPAPAQGEDEAMQSSSSLDADSQAERGTGWVLIDGDPAARASGSCVVSGARAGVDGTYHVTEAEHNYSRGTGYMTRISITQPQQSAGQDVRPMW